MYYKFYVTRLHAHSKSRILILGTGRRPGARYRSVRNNTYCCVLSSSSTSQWKWKANCTTTSFIPVLTQSTVNKQSWTGSNILFPVFLKSAFFCTPAPSLMAWVGIEQYGFRENAEIWRIAVEQNILSSSSAYSSRTLQMIIVLESLAIHACCQHAAWKLHGWSKVSRTDISNMYRRSKKP